MRLALRLTLLSRTTAPHSSRPLAQLHMLCSSAVAEPALPAAGPPPGAALRAFVSHHSAAMQRSAPAPPAGDAAGASRAAAFSALAAELAAAAEAALAAEGGAPAGVPTDPKPGPALYEPSARPARAEDQERGEMEAARGGEPSGRVGAAGGRRDAGRGMAAAARWLVACADPSYAHSLELCRRWAQAL